MRNGRMKMMAAMMAATMVLGTVGSFAATGSGTGTVNPTGQGRRAVAGATAGIGQAQRAIQTLSSGLEPAVMAEKAQSRIESAEDRLAKSALAALKEKYDAQYADEFAELETLRATARTRWEAINTVNTAIRAELERIREALRALGADAAQAELAALKGELETYRSAIDALRSEIRTLQQQKTQAWVQFRNAVRADDADAVGTALGAILSLKGQIIEKLDPLLAAKQAFLDHLKGIVAPAAAAPGV